MKLEVVVVPVSDVVQLTPPGSACSVIFGSGVTSAALRRAAAAHGKHEEEIGQAADWPDWYAQYMVDERNAQAAGA